MWAQLNTQAREIFPPVAIESPDTPEAIGKRLKRLRYALGYGDSPTRWGEWLGDVSPGQWVFYEKGERWLPPEVAIKLCIKANVTTDWLYRGLEGTVAPDTMARILSVPEADKLPAARNRTKPPPGKRAS